MYFNVHSSDVITALDTYHSSSICRYIKIIAFIDSQGGNGGRVVTLSPPTSEVRVWFPALPQVGKLVVPCRWSAVYSTKL